jgi:peptidoglycan-associated lipoprotein
MTMQTKKIAVAMAAATMLFVGACARREAPPAPTTPPPPPPPAPTAEAPPPPPAPAAPRFAPGSQEDLVATVGTDRVFFSFDSSELGADAQETLRKQAAWMATNAGVAITVEGHCDERGTREYNLALGDRRAESVKSFLVSLGVAASRIDTISYGKERPEALGSNEEAWAQNRRGVSMVKGGGLVN